MKQEEVIEIFDKMAPSYDQQWLKLAPVNALLHLLTGAALATLPPRSKILCIGAGTGAEIVYLATRFPEWTFVAVDPSAPMLDVCRRKLAELGMDSRCEFHSGYLESLHSPDLFDAATSILVSQFILDKASRTEFFRTIASSLKPGGMLVSADLSATQESISYQKLLQIWLQMMKGAGVNDEAVDRIRVTYEKDVAVLPESEVAAMIQSGGFEDPVCFYQAGLIRAWHSRVSADLTSHQGSVSQISR